MAWTGREAPENRRRFDAEQLRGFTSAILRSYGVPQQDAEVGADVLIDADLVGIDSHGIAHLPWHIGYAPGFESGVVNPTPEIKVLRETPVSAAWDGDGGFGTIVCHKAMSTCIEKAQTSGLGMVTVRNGRHFGAAGYYAHMAVEHDLIGMAMCNAPPIGLASGGKRRVYGTNPIAMAAPVDDDTPFRLDIATTAVAGGKLEIAGRQGKPLPVGWALDEDGKHTDDPFILRKNGGLLPLGSTITTSSHKGYGLGLMVDILTGVLSGDGSGMFIPRGQSLIQGQWFAAWRIDLFCDPDEFKSNMKRMVDAIRDVPPVDEVERVVIPGDPEEIARADRSLKGVPLDDETIEQLIALGEQRGVAFPAPMQGGGA
ncbi:MAG: Ldh family oxidoreductase [Chloroflexi bacterium]|nr:Ldh family oxidoreductase [Chloroflexota bacterium]MYF80380.1 Ldh family oxidoreductase [Chloroflexota bacterium]MYI04788.1 Ldh family oxidoreductase [Chloroflexota bacterium]